MNDIYQEVYFEQYCESCEHLDKLETDWPCVECLENGVNVNSHKPVNWEEKEYTACGICLPNKGGLSNGKDP